MNKLQDSLVRRIVEFTLVVVLVFAAYECYRSLFAEELSETNLSLRVPSYPQTYISRIKVDLASPNHWVTLDWSGPGARELRTGPFHSSPGVGLGTNNCNDVSESNRQDSNCTPKGQFSVQGVGDTLPTSDIAMYVTWIDMPRSIALHAYPDVPNVPASHGCIRLDHNAAQLIHNNVLVGQTVVDIGGTWSRPIDRRRLRAQLVLHEGRRWNVYTDTLGNRSIGVGFNLERANAKEAIEAIGVDFDELLSGGKSLNDDQIDTLLERDVDDAIDCCVQTFPNFGELTSVRQRVLVDMAFNLGRDRLHSFKKMIEAVNLEDFEMAAREMEDSKWYGQVKGRGVTLVAMMKTGEDKSERPLNAAVAPIVDCKMSREQALEGIRIDFPDEIRGRLELVDVQYYSFDAELHQGQVVIDRDLVDEIKVVFQIMRDYRFPVGSVIPLSHSKFRKLGLWNDKLSMAANNSFAFNCSAATDKKPFSLHSFGRAIDINPMQNPFFECDAMSPRGARYVISEPGTLSAEHPVVQAFLDLGWQWGGYCHGEKDYQHFEKSMDEGIGGSLQAHQSM